MLSNNAIRRTVSLRRPRDYHASNPRQNVWLIDDPRRGRNDLVVGCPEPAISSRSRAGHDVCCFDVSANENAADLGIGIHRAAARVAVACSDRRVVARQDFGEASRAKDIDLFENSSRADAPPETIAAFPSLPVMSPLMVSFEI
jgi:hypothetical protein